MNRSHKPRSHKPRNPETQKAETEKPRSQKWRNPKTQVRDGARAWATVRERRRRCAKVAERRVFFTASSDPLYAEAASILESGE
ncbi:hypothetical protein HN873_007542 [Arachis hypogaea]